MPSKKDIARFDEDSELWDSRVLGASEDHAKPAPEEESKAIDSALGMRLLSIRLQYELIAQLKQLAKLEGIGYQPLMRQVLTRYVRENEHRIHGTVQQRNGNQVQSP